MKKLLLLLVLLGGFTAFGQGTITGSLMDMDLGGPLPGANVIEAGTNNGVVTDFDGNFSITVAKAKEHLSLAMLDTKQRQFLTHYLEKLLHLGLFQ